jgi:trehalose/maltose transport system permease protein
MKKRITLKQFLFLLPMLALITVFSLYPILSSFVYTVFDYRTNDRQTNQLFLSGSMNTDLFAENCDYIDYFLRDDLTLVADQDAQVFETVCTKMAETKKQLEGAEGKKLNQEEIENLRGLMQDTRIQLDSVYNSYPDVSFYNKDKVFVILDEMETCFIDSNFVGLANYQKLLSDHRFSVTLKNTLFFTAVTVAVEFVLGMGLALVMSQALRGIGLIRTAVLIPWAIPTAVSALIWSYLYDGSSGIVAQLFYHLGLCASPQQMLLSASGAMVSAIIADIWKTTPYMALLLLAGLQSIDPGLYESAAIDGSGKVHTFFNITMPMMKSSILIALLFRTLDAFRVYDLIAILTGGGPGGATETLSIYAYKVMMSQSNYGYGSVIVVAMFVCVAVIAFFFIKVLGAEVMQDD